MWEKPTWSIGGNIHDDSRDKFDGFMKERFAPIVSSKYALLLQQDVYHVYVDLPSKSVKLWDFIMPHFSYDPSMPYFSILVPTVDNTRYRYLLDKLMNNGYNVLFMGDGRWQECCYQFFLNDMVHEARSILRDGL